ncbi:unnamed protein product [Tuber aestivum]|uniref:Uncharacterized protein n=1 Tax=Tuber aestivum TaxID=59557 RepID=A0A292PQI1_9PEZI|nr:unnamed protein product [Tuber aestivum]
MLQDCNPHASLDLIHEMNLPVLPAQYMKIAADTMLHRPFGSNVSHPRISKLLTTSSKRYHAWLIAAMSPWKNQSPFQAYNNNTRRCHSYKRGSKNMVINLEHWSRGRTGVGERSVMDKYETFLKTIAEEGLEEAFSFKIFLKMKPAIEKSLQHRLENPQEGKDELLEWVRRSRQALLNGLEYVGVGMGKGEKTGCGRRK